MAITLGIGLLVGFERESGPTRISAYGPLRLLRYWGTLAALISPVFVIACFAGVLVLVTVVHVGNALHDRPLETTTSAALMVTFSLGVLTGKGHVFTPTHSPS